MPTIVPAAQFRGACDSVDYWRASLRSCVDPEVPREAQAVVRAMTELLGLQPKRPTSELEQLRTRALSRASELLQQRAPAQWEAYSANV